MTNFSRIQEINNQCMRNIENIMNDSKNVIKNFKMQQADIMKNIMVSTDNSANLEQEFRKFQQELNQREQEQYNQINGRIGNEIENMKRLIIQELSSPSISTTNSYIPTPMPSSYLNNNNNNMGSETLDLSSFGGGSSNDNLSNYSQSYNTSSQSMNRMSDSMSNNSTDALLSELNNLASNNNTTNNNNTDPAFNTNSMSQQQQQQPLASNDIPVETKELDEWISEIKNLI